MAGRVIKIVRKKDSPESTPQETPSAEDIAKSLEDPESNGGGKRGGQRVKKRVENVINIDLGDDICIRADALSWTLDFKGSTTFHSTLLGVFQVLFDRKLKTLQATTVQELADNIVQAQQWLHALIAPFCVWDGAQIHLYLSDEFKAACKQVHPTTEEGA